MSDQVHYHQHGREPIVLHIVGGDAQAKTVNLAREPKGPVIIEGIKLSEDKGDGNGVAVLIADAPKVKAKTDKKSKDKTPEPTEDGKPSEEGEGEKPSTPPVDQEQPPPDE